MSRPGRFSPSQKVRAVPSRTVLRVCIQTAMGRVALAPQAEGQARSRAANLR